jgi:hypothetical protein
VARIVYEDEQRSKRLTKWLLLAGPAYENSKYKCSILIETKKLFVWAITFGKTIILQNENQLESVRYLATQVINANNDDDKDNNGDNDDNGDNDSYDNANDDADDDNDGNDDNDTDSN